MKILKNTASSDCIRISWYNEKTDLLGPFFRFVLWVQGCERRCPGCIAENMHSLTGGSEMKLYDLASLVISADECEGITISGGEPFYQADKICTLIEMIKSTRPDFGVIIYTGYRINELKNTGEEAVQKLINLADIIIDGPYEETLDDNKGLRGSSNQNVIFLTDRYKNMSEIYTNPGGRRNKIEITETSLRMTGVPSENTKQFLKEPLIKSRLTT